jgi:hypothetical protein
MMPPAPERLSITSCWVNACARRLDTMRATMSVAPPTATGTIKRTGRCGYAVDCACAAPIVIGGDTLNTVTPA